MNHRHVRWVFPFFLITVAVYFLSSLLLFFADLELVDYSPPVFHERPQIRPPSPGASSGKEYKALLERNLFAVKVDESTPAKGGDLLANIDNLELTSLNCTLIGTVIREGSDSWAIIRDNQSSKEEKVSAGSLFSGAKVVLILRNKVVLNFNGKDELLVMGIEKIRAERQAQQEAGKGEEGAGQVAAYKVSKDFIAKSINDLPKIMATVRIKPYVKDNKPQGFQVTRIKQGSLLKTMGFQDNDIIKSVNGQNIRSPEDVMKVYNSLKDSTFFSVTIERNNQLKTLNYKVR